MNDTADSLSVNDKKPLTLEEFNRLIDEAEEAFRPHEADRLRDQRDLSRWSAPEQIDADDGERVVEALNALASWNAETNGRDTWRESPVFIESHRRERVESHRRACVETATAADAGDEDAPTTMDRLAQTRDDLYMAADRIAAEVAAQGFSLLEQRLLGRISSLSEWLEDDRDRWRASGGPRADEAYWLAVETERMKASEPPKKYSIDFIDSGTFASTDYHQSFLVKSTLVHGQPCIMGGAQKTLKTSAAVDLAISLGTGTRFLGEFEVPEAVPVGLLSGESGAFTLQETARRVANARGLLLSSAMVCWGFKLPQLGLTEHLQALADAVIKRGLKALIIDPAYLCMLLKDDGSSISFSNVFEMGAVLGKVSQTFAALDCTPIILHHESKGASSFRRRGDYGPPELSDLSMAGFAEWARQWLLLARREAYQHGSGIHRLWLNAGGSAGHGRLSAVDIDEGQLQEDFSGRKWGVTVLRPDEVRQSQSDARETRKNAKDDERDRRDVEKLLEAYAKFPDGDTARAVRSVANLSGERFPYINQKLIDAGHVEAVAIKKKTGTFDGFRIVPQDVDADRIQSLFPEIGARQ